MRRPPVVDITKERIHLGAWGTRAFRISALLGVIGLAVSLFLGAQAGDHWGRFLEAYLVRLASKRRGYNLSARRQGIYYRHKNGMPPDEIAADMNLHVSTVKDTLTKVGLFTPRTYKKHLTGEPA